MKVFEISSDGCVEHGTLEVSERGFFVGLVWRILGLAGPREIIITQSAQKSKRTHTHFEGPLSEYHPVTFS